MEISRLWHLNDSLELLYEGLTEAVIGWEPVAQAGTRSVAFFHLWTRRLQVVAATSAGPDSPIMIGDRYLPRGTLIAVGTVRSLATPGTSPGPADATGPFRR
ncbi:hypothetical protein GCM10023334_076670 [Nonomuraea thailandensis]